MDKVLSARVDEAVVRRIANLARRLHTTKKAVIEGAIQMYAAKVEQESELDVLEETLGAWAREESASQTVKRAREAFRDSMRRHQE
jgi:predicted transcriptional regulator